MARILRSLLALTILSISCSAGANSPASQETDSIAATHKQWRTIKPAYKGHDATLQTYCLDKDGRLWLSVQVSGSGTFQLPFGASNAAKPAFQGLLVYDGDGKQIAAYPLNFTARAMNFAPDGSLFVAGEGKIAHVAADGSVIKEAATPNIGDYEQFKKDAVAAAKKQAEEATKTYKAQLENIDAMIKRIEESKADQDSNKAQIEALKQQRKQWEQVISSLSSAGEMDPDQIARQKLYTPGLAVNDRDVFVCCSSSTGHGFDVWRTNYDFEEGKQVVKGLSGCCGNMDIQCKGDQLVAAENGRFRVTIYDRDGKQLSSFGKRDRVKPDGFGSCCNPMNVRCLQDGTVLAAESSIGNIKKFSADGDFLGTVGKAKIAGGCKNVALGYDPSRDHYYMLNTDRNHICVLVPLAEAPGQTEDEKQAEEAANGLGKKLTGTWKIPGAKASKAKPKTTRVPFIFPSTETNANANAEIQFHPDGKLQAKGTQLDRYGSMEMEWHPVKQEGNVLEVSMLFDGVEVQTFSVTFQGDDEIKFDRCYYFPSGRSFARVSDNPDGSREESTDAKAEPPAKEDAESLK